MNILNIILSCIFILTIHSHPLTVNYNLDNLSPSQINHLCSYISQLPEENSINSESPIKRFARPFPDMNRFLSTSHKLHSHQSEGKSQTESSSKIQDFHAYLCSLSKDSTEMTNFMNIFVGEHGQSPAFDIFESCEEVTKRDELKSNNNKRSAVRLNELSEYCSNQPTSRVTKRWKHTVAGPISIDFIHQMLESRKVKSYPYRAEMDPYLVGR